MPEKESRTPRLRLLLDNVAPLRYVQTIQELSDILVANAADLLDVGGGLRYVLEALRCVSPGIVTGIKPLTFPLS